MASKSKIKRYLTRFLLTVLILMILAFVSLYALMSSPRFLRFVIDRVNDGIPGEIVYETLTLNPKQRTLQATELQYVNEQGQTAFAVSSLELKFNALAAFRGRLDVRDLNIQNFKLDTEKFPKRKSINPIQWRTVLQLILNRLVIQNSLLTSVDLAFKGGTTVHVDEVQMILTPQILGNQKFHLTTTQSQTQWKQKTFKTQAITFDGAIDIPILRDYNFFVKAAEGILKITGLELPHLQVGTLTTQFELDGDTLKLQEGQFTNSHGTLNLDLTYDSATPALELELKNTEPIIFGAIPRASSRLQETFTGFKIDLKTDLKGSKLEELDGSIDLVVDALGNRGHDNTLDHRLTLQGKIDQGVINFTLFEITSEKMNLKATGWVNFPKMTVDAKVKTQSFDITALVNTLADIDLSGYADAEGTITGSLKSPNFDIQAKASEAGYSFMNFGEVEGNFKIQDGTLSFVGGSPQGSEAFTQVDVRTTEIFKKNRTTYLKSQFRNLDAGKLLLNEEFQGKISGSYEMEASKTQKDGTLKATIDNFSLYDFYFTQVETVGKLENDQFILNPTTFQPVDYDKLTMPEPTVFSFDDRGWQVKGTIQPGITLEGKFLESRPTQVALDIKLNNVDLRPILASMKMPAQQSYADGEINMLIGVDDAPSSISLNFSRFDLPMEEGFIRNDGNVEVVITPPKIDFKKARFLSGEGVFEIDGAYTLDGPIGLRVKGKVNLGVLNFVPKYFRSAEGYADVDLRVSGVYEDPRFEGEITFSNANITLRPVRGEIEDFNGTIKFTPNVVVFENLQGTMREGDLAINGQVNLKNLKPTYYDLKIATREVAVSEPGVYKIIFSGDFTLKGPAGKAVLSGTMDINDGVYSRDFSIAQSILRPSSSELKKEPMSFLKDLVLDLTVRSPGELAVKNNIARIYFNSDLRLTGPATDPKISGAMEVLDGEFHYFTVDFEGARGTIDFRDPQKGPYVDIILEKTYQAAFQTITVAVKIEGFTDNLQMTFDSSPPLERRDIMTLVFTGSLPGDARRSLSGTNIASTVLATQLSQIIQKPLAQKAHLDIFRLEATDPDTRSGAFSTLVIGKKLTDRLSLEFKTDLGVDQPLQGVQMEYLLLDNILIKGTQFSDGEFDFNLALRFQFF